MDKKKYAVDLLVKACEGIRLSAYKDSAGILTIGIGLARHYPDGTEIQQDDTCTEEQAYFWLNYHLEKNVYPYVDKLQAQYQFNDKIYAALCSLAYNVGTGALKGDNIVAALESADLDDLAKAFSEYDKITVKGQKQVCPGLVRRRKIEIKYFQSVN